MTAASHSKGQTLANLLGSQTFAELLACLPDRFFFLRQEEQAEAWQRMLDLALFYQIHDPERLAAAACSAGVTVSNP